MFIIINQFNTFKLQYLLLFLFLYKCKSFMILYCKNYNIVQWLLLQIFYRIMNSLDSSMSFYIS